ncbi:MAG: CDP-alcohol phosphatidyltransferase family protein [Clostridiales bacterium]|nr:CDP-alcohol phosphatidyltransferase family protein [Clostridiales bacterium]MDD7347294.1 CDP-alcohol phosphatidyltransferase family protein [Clostridiales bacterium]MDY4061149.1 CDP-alcohol phosphatidyltransferase family protein [Anaerovoracaceae bacterium]
MIGVYNYTVVLTYLSVVSAAAGMMFAVNGHFRMALVCLALSGLFDMFDGKVARRKKNRTYEEKMFGVQIDSLCDCIAFGFYPAIYCYLIGVQGKAGIIAIVLYVIAAVIRLAYFNVLEISKGQDGEGGTKYYHGLPVTSISVILPIVFLLNFITSDKVFYWILVVTLLGTGTAFVWDFKFRKPTNKELFIIVGIVAFVLVASLLYKRYIPASPPVEFVQL